MNTRDMAYVQFFDFGADRVESDFGNHAADSYLRAVDRAFRDGYRNIRLVRGIWADDTPMCIGHSRIILRTVSEVLP